jgi:hypothetical protein
MFTVTLWDRNGVQARAEQLTLAPLWLAATAVGGPERAEVRVTGTPEALWQIADWMQYRVEIRSETGALVWWGFVERATVGFGPVQLGRTLEGMANRLQVAYTCEDATGGQTRGDTAWTQDNASVAAYGRFETRLSLADAEETEALAYGATELRKRAAPAAVAELGNEAREGLLGCRGWWGTLERTFYADDRGLEEYKGTVSLEYVLGWQLTGQTNIGFNGTRMDDLAARLAAVRPGNRLRVVGSTSNDGIYVVQSGPDEGSTVLTLTSDDIAFERFDDILSSSGGLEIFRLGYMVFTSGSGQTENSGSFWVTKEHPERMEVEPATMVDEFAIGPITLTQGHALTAATDELPNDGKFFQEKAGASLAVYHGANKVAQRFRLSSATGWTVREVRVQAAKVGSPSDNLRVRIYSGTATEPVTVLIAATKAPADVSTEMGWLTFDLGAGVALSPATDYWLSIDRDGAASVTNFYLAGLESGEDLDYPYTLKVQDGYTGWWEDPLPDATQQCRMPFRLSGRTATTVQLRDMLDAADSVTAVTIRTASGVETGIYRDGEQTVLAEVERLLEMGTSAGGRLLARIMPDRSAIVEAAPVADGAPLRMNGAGQVRHHMGQPLAAGELPAGAWVAVDGVPAGWEKLALFFVERAEYDVDGGRLRLEPTPNEA